ncbi:MAG: CBS domain-containing protein [Pseudomonadota bacterium]|nr:CBS domain-containing protein [Pseudomonadota bacterium]
MKTVRDVMTPNPAYCTPTTRVHEVARLMVESDCGSIPVLTSEEDRTPVGTVTDRDIVCRLVAQGRNPLDCEARDCMTTPCVTVPVDSDLNAARDLMMQHRIRRVVVVDENAECVGIVSLADIVLETGDTNVVREVSEPIEEPARIPKRETEPA